MVVLNFFTAALTLLTKHPYKVIIAVLVIIIVLQMSCSPDVKPCPECDTFDTTAFIATLPIKYVDTNSYIPTPIPEPIYIKGDVVEKTIPADIDSLAVAQAYYASWRLRDTILNDTNGFIVINDLISQNQIMERFIFPKEIYPHFKIVTETKYRIRPPKTKVFIGFGLMYSAGNNPSMSANIALVTKKDLLLGMGFDPFTKTADVRMYWKLKFRR